MDTGILYTTNLLVGSTCKGGMYCYSVLKLAYHILVFTITKAWSDGHKLANVYRVVCFQKEVAFLAFVLHIEVCDDFYLTPCLY